MNRQEREKYTARNWLVMSPHGGNTAIVCFESAVSFASMEKRFPGWKMRALFPSEKKVAEAKAKRLSD